MISHDMIENKKRDRSLHTVTFSDKNFSFVAFFYLKQYSLVECEAM
jgi:hypothetical protein